MTKYFRLVFVTLGLCWQVSGIKIYDNYTLVKITPQNLEQLNVLKELHGTGPRDVHVLKRSHGPNDSSDILVPPTREEAVKELAARLGIAIQYKKNYGRSIEANHSHLRHTKSNKFNLYGFNSYDAITKHILAHAKKNPELVKLETLGRSYEGRELKLLKISTDHEAGRPIMFIEAGTHAREWAGPALALYIIEKLMHCADAELDVVDWYILPLVNPDGYEFTRTHRTNRLWRKNRSKSKNSRCFGVDLNRNYGFKWGTVDTSSDPCEEEIYGGTGPFSEPETRIVRNVMKKYSRRIKLYAGIHSYGQYLVYPWGYTKKTLPYDWKKLHYLAQKFSKSVVRAGGKPFHVMSSGKWYPVAGSSDDYAYGVVKIPYSYTLEITTGYEFTLPAKLLKTVLPPYYEGFRTFAEHINKEFGKYDLT